MENNQALIAQCESKAKQWLSPAFDKETRSAVNRMIANEDKTDLIESFYKDLEFGTGGLRGIMGAGSNRMNIYTVGMATQGFANYLKINFKDKKQISVVVCHDCRNNSRLFAETVANIFSANGIKVYLFEDLRPTPEVSFAIRHLGCQSGVNLTASHNPKEYNGYKAYWEDGAQVLAPHDKGIIDEVNKVRVEDVKFEGNPALIQTIGAEIDEAYLKGVKELSIDPEVIQRQKDLSIVYTPLHGAGRVLVPSALKSWGFENVNTVTEQMVKDGNFPTVVSPNPENGEALTLALNLAKKIDADIVMASDPDADRIGVAVRNTEGKIVLINGNEICALLGLSRRAGMVLVGSDSVQSQCGRGPLLLLTAEDCSASVLEFADRLASAGARAHTHIRAPLSVERLSLALGTGRVQVIALPGRSGLADRIKVLLGEGGHALEQQNTGL